MYKRIVFKLCLCLVCGGLTRLPIVYGFNLSDAYQNALLYNADYLAKIFQNKANQESQNQSISYLLPKVSISSGINEIYTDSLSAGSGYYVYHQPFAGLNFSQVIVDFSKFSAYTKSKYATQVADLVLEDAKQALFLDVAKAYFDLLCAMDTLEATKMNKNADEQQMIQAQKRFNAGVATITDFNDAKASFDKMNAKVIQMETNLISKQNNFKNLTGLNPELIQPLIDNLSLVPLTPNNVEEWVNYANMGNLKIKIANKKLQMAGEDISVEKSGHLPNLNLSGTYRYTDTANVDTSSVTSTYSNISGIPSSNQVTFGLQLNIPIYSGGVISSKVREMIATYESEQQLLVFAKREAQQNVRNSFWKAQNGTHLINAQIQALKSAGLKLKSDKIAYQSGIRDSIDLLNSQKDYYAVLQDYNQAKYDYLYSIVELNYHAGKINLDVFRQINTNIKQ